MNANTLRKITKQIERLKKTVLEMESNLGLAH
jgi:hypothetical protein